MPASNTEAVGRKKAIDITEKVIDIYFKALEAKKRMPRDALTYALCAKELNEKLSGGRINKITMPSPDTLVLNIRTVGQNVSLLLSANPSHPRIHLTQASYESPKVAPRFLMHLRKHLASGSIEEVKLVPFERIIEIKIRAYNELMIAESKRLIIELMGKHSNIILVSNNGTISDSIKHVSEDVSTKRQVMSGLPYHLPPSQADRFDVSQKDRLKLRLTEFEGGNLEKFLSSCLSGLATASIKEAVCTAYNAKTTLFGAKTTLFGAKSSLFDAKPTFAGGLSDDEIELVIGALDALYNLENVKPCATKRGDGLSDFFVRKYESAVADEAEIVYFDTLNAAMDAFYSSLSSGQVHADKRNRLLAIINGAIGKSQKKLGALMQKQQDALDYEDERKKGDLILSNIYRIRKGDSAIEVEDFFDDNKLVRIAIDSHKTPQANAQVYYKSYNKKKTALSVLGGFIDELNENIDYLESLIYFAEAAARDEEFSEIADELCRLGFARKKVAKTQKQKQKQPKQDHLTYKGYKIFVGKSSLANEALIKKSSPLSIWLHASKIHGSHVVIENNTQSPPPDDVIKHAAILAATNSKAKHSQNVPVDYTLIKNIKKPKGAAPGKVIYSSQKTIYVTPSAVEN